MDIKNSQFRVARKVIKDRNERILEEIRNRPVEKVTIHPNLCVCGHYISEHSGLGKCNGHYDVKTIKDEDDSLKICTCYGFYLWFTNTEPVEKPKWVRAFYGHLSNHNHRKSYVVYSTVNYDEWKCNYEYEHTIERIKLGEEITVDCEHIISTKHVLEYLHSVWRREYAFEKQVKEMKEEQKINKIPIE